MDPCRFQWPRVTLKEVNFFQAGLRKRLYIRSYRLARNEQIRQGNTRGEWTYFKESATPLHIVQMRRAVCQQ